MYYTSYSDDYKHFPQHEPTLGESEFDKVDKMIYIFFTLSSEHQTCRLQHFI